MKILGDIALVLLTVVGYSSGSVLAGSGRKVSPGIIDIVLVVLIWIAALTTHFSESKWILLLIWIPLAICIGAIATLLRIKQYSSDKKAPKVSTSNLLKKAWNDWKEFANRLGNYQSRVWLALAYFVLIVPFGILMRLFINPWQSGFKGGISMWKKKEPVKTDLTSARDQF